MRKERKQPIYAEQALWGIIIDKHGTPTKLAKILGVTPQILINYRNRGSDASIDVLTKISKGLGISKWVLAYNTMQKINPDNKKPWFDYLDSCKVLTTEEKSIIKSYPLKGD